MKRLRDLRSDDVTVQSRPGHRKVRRLLGTIIDRKLSSPLWTGPAESISSTWRRIFVHVQSWISNFFHRAPNSETCRTIDLMLTFGESSNAQRSDLDGWPVHADLCGQLNTTTRVNIGTRPLKQYRTRLTKRRGIESDTQQRGTT